MVPPKPSPWRTHRCRRRRSPAAAAEPPTRRRLPTSEPCYTQETCVQVLCTTIWPYSVYLFLSSNVTVLGTKAYTSRVRACTTRASRPLHPIDVAAACSAGCRAIGSSSPLSSSTRRMTTTRRSTRAFRSSTMPSVSWVRSRSRAASSGRGEGTARTHVAFRFCNHIRGRCELGII